MKSIGNDRWRADIPASEVGRYLYTVEGWMDRFGTWRHTMIKRMGSGQDVRTDCLIGANLVEDAASRAGDEDAGKLRGWARKLRNENDLEQSKREALGAELAALVQCYPDRRFAV